MALSKTALTFVVIGAVNWLLVGLFQFDVIASLFGGTNTVASRIIYVIIGLAGLYCITLLFDNHAERSKR
ncbi:MAG: DUF378 domain-containing protein [Alicyclobacillaceae bacterium]|nr:DUF378 domain-containing protein [Alicyclobacillaceae bacterium]